MATTTAASTAAKSYAFNTSGGIITIGFAVITLISTAAVALRFYARRLAAVRPALDDHLAAAALVLNYGLFVVTVLALGYGDLGAPTTDPDAVSSLFKCLLSFSFLYAAAATTTKLSVLAFYHRVFPTAFMRRACALLGAVSLLYGTSFVVVSAAQCSPPSAFWQLRRGTPPDSDGQSQGRCVDVLLFYLVMALVDTVIDALVLCLPVREVLRLQTSRAKKAGICGVFGMGGIAVVASATRINAVLKWYRQGIDSPTDNVAGPWAAASVEIGAAILGSCLPVLPPVWFCLRRKSRRLSRSLRNSHDSSRDLKTRKNKHAQQPAGASDTSNNKNRKLFASSTRKSRKSDVSAAVHSVLTIGRISSLKNNNNNRHHYNNRRRLTLTETGFELEGTRFERIESPVDVEAPAAHMRSDEQRLEEGEGRTESQHACLKDARDQSGSTVEEVKHTPEHDQQHISKDKIDFAGPASSNQDTV